MKTISNWILEQQFEETENYLDRSSNGSSSAGKNAVYIITDNDMIGGGHQPGGVCPFRYDIC